MNKICYGCGVKLQTIDKEKQGFTPKEDGVYCQRCFKLMHYGINNETSAPKSNTSIINTINKDNKFVIFLVPFFNIRSEIIKTFNKIKTDKILVISKKDLIPKSIKEENISLFLKNYYNITSKIKFISSTSNIGINNLIKYLEKNNITETYILGETNSGKSTFINKILDLYNIKLNKITISNVPNTTLDFIRMPLSENLTIIDSPGFVFDVRSEDINYKQKGEIKPRTFQMKENEILAIDNIYLKFKKNANITVYTNNNTFIKKYYKEVIFKSCLNISANSDLIIKGLGFINIKQDCEIKFSNIEQKHLEIRESIFGVNHEQD